MYLKRLFLALNLMIVAVTHPVVSAGSISLSAGGNIVLDDIEQAAKSIEIRGKAVFGHGVLDSKKITIFCDEFFFGGIIHCDEECKIYVKKDFDHTIFTKEGSGDFTVIVNPFTAEKYTASALLNKADTLFFKDIAALTEESIHAYAAYLRHQAFMNGIDEQVIIGGIHEKIKLMSTDTPVKAVSEKTGFSSELGKTLIITGLGLGGLSAAALMFSNNTREAETELVFGLGSISCLVFLEGVNRFLKSYKKMSPVSQKIEHQLSPELREKLTWLQQVIDSIFAEPYVSPVKVIKL